MSPTGVSVLIVSHGTRELLDGCLARLGGLSDEWDEILVVDNASTDGTPEMVRSRHPGVRLFPQEVNLGFGAANNLAAREARGDLLLLLNSDAWPEEGTIRRLAGNLRDDPGLGAVAPTLVYPDGRRQFTWVPDTSVLGEILQTLRNPFEGRPWNHELVPRVLRRLAGPGWTTAACLLVRRRAFEDVSGFDERFFLYFEDVDLALRLRTAGWRLERVRDARAVHVKGGSEPGTSSRLEYRRAQLLFYRLHRPAWEQRIIRRRLRRHARREEDPELRRGLQELLDAEPGAADSPGPPG